MQVSTLFDPIKYRVRDIANKMALLDREVKYLVNKAKIWKPKLEKPATNTSKTSESSAPEDKPKSRSESDETPKDDTTIESDDLAFGGETGKHEGNEDEIARGPEDVAVEKEELKTKNKTEKHEDSAAKTKAKEVADDSSHEEL